MRSVSARCITTGSIASHDFEFASRVMRVQRVLTSELRCARICDDMPASLGEPLLDINAVAEYLGVSEDTVRRMIDRGALRLRPS